MGTARRVAKNVGVLFAADVVGSLLSLVLVFAIARSLGDVGLGKYSFALAFASLFILFSDFGTNILVVKDIAVDRSKARAYAGNMLTLKLVLGVLAFIVSVTVIWLSGASAETVRLVVIASLAMFFNYFGYLFRSLYQAFEVLEFDALTKVLERVLTVGFGLAVLFLGFGVTAVLATQVASFLIFFLASWALTSAKVVPLRFHCDVRMMGRILHASMPFWLTGVFMYIYSRIDIVMLSFITSSFPQVGWYSAAYKITDALTFLEVIVIAAVFPVFSRFHAGDDRKMLGVAFSRSFYYLFAISLPLAVGGIMLADRIIPFVYGAGFGPAAPALQILFVALFFAFLSYVMGFLLNATGRGYQFTAVVVFAAALNIGTNLVVLPHFGFIGASWTTVLSEVVNFAFFAVLIYRAGVYLPLRALLRPTLCAVAMALAVLWLAALPLLLLVSIGGAVYFVLMFLIGGISREEIRLIAGRNAPK